MDSLTQIVLGAAVGEVTLGRKIGNRAMVWGAVAGTIPDLDVFVGKLLYSPTGALAFHRGITHSIFFAVFFSLAIAYVVHQYYLRRYYKFPLVKSAALLIMGVFLLVLLGAGGYAVVKGDYMWLKGVGVGIVALSGWLGKRLYTNYFLQETPDIDTTYRDWYRLFFWCIFTHPLLDCLTTYGTQLFQPFSHYRVGLNAISVADPIYTLPFLLCLITASMLVRTSEKRRLFNWIGIALSSAYLLFTVWNKHRVNHVMEKTLEEDKIDYLRYSTNPSILNNVLWSGTVETDTLYYWGQYSLLDKEKRFKLSPIAKNHHLISDIDGDYTIETLKWFSNGYYNVLALPDGNLQINDLRFGMYEMPEDTGDKNYIFRFVVVKEEDGTYELSNEPGRPENMDAGKMASELWKRINGI